MRRVERRVIYSADCPLHKQQQNRSPRFSAPCCEQHGFCLPQQGMGYPPRRPRGAQIWPRHDRDASSADSRANRHRSTSSAGNAGGTLWLSAAPNGTAFAGAGDHLITTCALPGVFSAAFVFPSAGRRSVSPCGLYRRFILKSLRSVPEFATPPCHRHLYSQKLTNRSVLLRPASPIRLRTCLFNPNNAIRFHHFLRSFQRAWWIRNGALAIRP
jgi:hypothetical protein